MAKKLTKIDQQRIDFLNNIDFSDWKKVKDNIHYIYSGDYSKIFGRYHDVMLDYYTRKNDEEFVKKWWLTMIHENLQRDVNLHEYQVTSQKANFAINWDSAAYKIIEEAKNKMHWVFIELKR